MCALCHPYLVSLLFMASLNRRVSCKRNNVDARVTSRLGAENPRKMHWHACSKGLADGQLVLPSTYTYRYSVTTEEYCSS